MSGDSACFMVLLTRSRYTIQISSLSFSQQSKISLITVESRSLSSPLRYGIKTPFSLFLMLVVSLSNDYHLFPFYVALFGLF